MDQSSHNSTWAGYWSTEGGDDTLKEVSWPHIDILDIDTNNVDNITIPMPSAYPPEVQQHLLFKSFVIAEGKILEGKANNILQQLWTKLTCQALLNIETKGSTGRIAKTRNMKILEQTKSNISNLQNDYNAVFETLQTITPDLDRSKYQRLNDVHLIPFNLHHLKLNTKTQRIPWIWKSSLEIFHTDKQIENWNVESLLV